jgi:SAM-dependent methyltransferase
MAFQVSAAAYDAFMGRFSTPLAEVFLDTVTAGRRRDASVSGDLGDVLDVGCGPGALTQALVRRTEATRVTAVDPQAVFLEAVRRRCPGVRTVVSSAESLPFPAGSFDLALAQLVVHFMSDPVAGLREMARVTRRGGRVAACVWDHGGGGGPLSLFWRAVTDLDPRARTEGVLPGTAEGQLGALARDAGLRDVTEGLVAVDVPFATFEEWWAPFTLGVGPAGDHVASLGSADVERLRRRCRELLPPEPFEVRAAAWCLHADC